MEPQTGVQATMFRTLMKSEAYGYGYLVSLALFWSALAVFCVILAR